MIPVSLVQLVVALLIVGLFLWAISQFQIDAAILKIIRVILIVVMSIWALWFIVGLLTVPPGQIFRR
jgi:hypothetical protein